MKGRGDTYVKVIQSQEAREQGIFMVREQRIKK